MDNRVFPYGRQLTKSKNIEMVALRKVWKRKNLLAHLFVQLWFCDWQLRAIKMVAISTFNISKNKKRKRMWLSGHSVSLGFPRDNIVSTPTQRWRRGAPFTNTACACAFRKKSHHHLMRLVPTRPCHRHTGEAHSWLGWANSDQTLKNTPTQPRNEETQAGLVRLNSKLGPLAKERETYREWTAMTTN